MGVLSFIQAVRFFIFRNQEKNGKRTFVEDKWPWVLVIINIFRNLSLLTVSSAKLIVSLSQTNIDVISLLSISNGIVFTYVPIIDLCTGMSILYLYHFLGINKMRESKRPYSKIVNSGFNSLNIDESEMQIKERLYEIKIKENRAAQHLKTEGESLIYTEIEQSYG